MRMSRFKPSESKPRSHVSVQVVQMQSHHVRSMKTLP